MKDSEFRELLKRYEQNQVTEQERQMLEAWLQTLTHDKDKVDVSDETGEAIRQKILAKIAEQKTKTIYFTPWLKIAAAVLVIIIATFTVWQVLQVDSIPMPIQMHTVTTAQKVILPDGSIIWLKENSTLTYPEKFTSDSRNISFTGEALFEITKDPSHPFVIAFNGVTAKVLGTSFNIKTDSLHTELTVLTGRVALNVVGQLSIVVKANEKAVYNDGQKELAIAALETPEAERVIAGTEYAMTFIDARMDAVAKRIEQKFNVIVTFDNAAMSNCPITADCTDRSLEATLQLISDALGYTYDINKNEVTLTGQGCP